MNKTTRHVDTKNAPAEEVLRQAVYLRSSLGRKASLQVCRGVGMRGLRRGQRLRVLLPPCVGLRQAAAQESDGCFGTVPLSQLNFWLPFHR